jgi:hypothetical protein
MILVVTDHPCLRVRYHNWYKSFTGVIHHVQQYFQKPTVRKCLEAHIRTIVVLIGSKLTRIYFLYLFYAIYFFVTVHQWKGKKVSIILLDDVNPILVPSRWGLLEDSVYRAVGAACPSCDESRPRTLGMWRPRNVLWSLTQDVNMFS